MEEDDDSFLKETASTGSSAPWFAEGEGDSEIDLDEDVDDDDIDEEEEDSALETENEYFDESSQFSESEYEPSNHPRNRELDEEGGPSTLPLFVPTVFSKARGQLQLSVLPKTLPCRETERLQLHSLLRDALANRATCSICTCPLIYSFIHSFIHS
jgi:hypothetical protein